MSNRSDFWNERYETGDTPWDFQGVPQDLRQFLQTAPPGSVLIPGSGFGYEIAAFLDAGWDAWGLDFSDAAVRIAGSRLGERAGRVLCGDFFTYRFPRRFDVVYERTFLCALDLSQRPAYAARLEELLKPDGQLAGYFYYGYDDDGPPHPLCTDEAEKLFRAFELTESRLVRDSLPIFEGKEYWQVRDRLRAAGPQSMS